MGRTPCDLAAENGRHEALELLLDEGGRMSYSFFHVVMNNYVDVVRVMLERGIEDISNKNAYLHHAVKNRNYDMVRLLINYGANVNSTDYSACATPLHLACEDNDKEMILILLQHGANRYAMDYNGITPFTHADSHGCYDTLILLTT